MAVPPALGGGALRIDAADIKVPLADRLGLSVPIITPECPNVGENERHRPREGRPAREEVRHAVVGTLNVGRASKLVVAADVAFVVRCDLTTHALTLGASVLSMP